MKHKNKHFWCKWMVYYLRIEIYVYYLMLKTGLDELMVMSDFTGASHESMML